jgi:RNA polymerase sigma factor (sigma-70 family)
MINDPTTYPTDAALLDDLKAEKEKAFTYVYRQYYRMTAQFIESNSGNADDAQDVFQEALIILVKNIRKPDFVLTVKLSTYLFSIVKKYWLYKLRGKKESGADIDTLNTSHLVEDGSELDIAHEYEVKHSIIGDVFQNLKEDCREMLGQFYFQKRSLGDIAKQFGWSDDFVKVKKRRCMEGLKNLVQNHQDFKKYEV